jgi:predicted dehydrogenase
VLSEKAAALAERYGARAYDRYEAMLRQEQPDVVDVCTREHQHVEPVLAALEAGADVLCEKIMAHTLAGGQAMVAAAERNARFLGVDYNYRFFPIFARMREMVEAGELGEIALVNVYAHAYCFHHALDLAPWLARPSAGPAVAVSGRYTASDDPRYHFPVQCPDFVYVPSRNAVLTISFQSGALGAVSSSRFEDLRANMLRVDVVGEQGRLTADGITTADIMGRLTHVALGPAAAGGAATREIRYYDGAERGFNVAFERSIAAFIAAVRAHRAGREGQALSRPAAGRSPGTAGLSRTQVGPSPATAGEGMSQAATGRDGYAVLRLERALVRSQAEGRAIALSELATA